MNLALLQSAAFHVLEEQLANLRSSITIQGEFALDASLEQQKLILADLPADRGAWPSNGANMELAEVLAKVLDEKHHASFGLCLKNGRIYSPERNDKVYLERRDVECLRNEIDRQQALNKK